MSNGCYTCKTKVSRGCCPKPKKLNCKYKEVYCYKKVCCKVTSCKSKCENKCKLVFKKVPILKARYRVPCKTPCPPKRDCCC